MEVPLIIRDDFEGDAINSESPHREDLAHGSSSSPRHRRLTRILDRDAAFSQSRGLWRVAHVSRDIVSRRSLGSSRRRLIRCWNDWFFILANQRTIVLVGILFFTYSAIVFTFAFVYWSVSWIGQEESKNADGSTSMVPFCDLVCDFGFRSIASDLASRYSCTSPH